MGIEDEGIEIFLINNLSSNIKNGYNEWLRSVIFSMLTFIAWFTSYIFTKNCR